MLSINSINQNQPNFKSKIKTNKLTPKKFEQLMHPAKKPFTNVEFEKLYAKFVAPEILKIKSNPNQSVEKVASSKFAAQKLEKLIDVIG